MKLNSFLTEDEVISLKTARKALGKIQKQIDRLEKIRTEMDNVMPVKRSAENGKNWKSASCELYELLDDMYKKVHVTTVDCESPSSDYLILAYRK